MLLLLNVSANANANAYTYANREANVSTVDSHLLNAKAIRPMPILMSTPFQIQMPTLFLTLMLSMRPPNANGNRIVKIVLIRILV